MTYEAPACPECGHPLNSGGLVSATREDDGQRICRTLWRFPQGHVWWRWMDRPTEPLQMCPFSNLFR